MSSKQCLLQIPCFSLVLLFICLASCYIGITLKNESNTRAVLEKYSSSLSDSRYSSGAEGNWIGYLLEVNPDVGCSDSQLHPIVSDSDWFAVFEQYPRCYDEAVLAVKAAGFKLMLIGDWAESSSSNIEFPVAAISRYYATYLINTTLSDETSPNIIASISINVDLMTVLISISSLIFIVVLIVVLVALSLLCLRIKYSYQRTSITRTNPRAPARTHPTAPTLAALRVHYDQLAAHSTLTSSLMLPLASEQAKSMGTATYQKSHSVECCGICLEELRTGDKVRDLPCGHNTFHVGCLDDWLQKGNRSCPVCRHNVTRDMANNRSLWRHQTGWSSSLATSRQNYQTMTNEV